MNRSTASRRARGFTLVEIMIVVLVVGILSSLAIFAVRRVKDHAQEVIVENTLRRLYNAKELYFSDLPAGKSPQVAFVSDLETAGFVSKTLAAAIEHPPGKWSYQGVLRPNQPVLANLRGATTGSFGASTARDTIVRSVYYPAPPK